MTEPDSRSSSMPPEKFHARHDSSLPESFSPATADPIAIYHAIKNGPQVPDPGIGLAATSSGDEKPLTTTNNSLSRRADEPATTRFYHGPINSRKPRKDSITHPGTVMSMVDESLRFLEETKDHDPELEHYAPRLIDMIQAVVPAEIHHGEVKLPKGARDSDALPMIAIPSGTKFTLERGFAHPTPTQMGSMLSTIHQWEPVKGSDEEMVEKLLAYARRERHSTTFGHIGGIDSITSNVLLRSSDFHQVKGGNVARICGRPLVVFQESPLATPTPAEFGHEQAHVKQLIDRALTLNNERNEGMMGMELEAFHVGAVIGRAMRNVGRPLRKIDVRQIEIDDIRLRHANPRDYTPTPAILNDLRTAGLLRYVMH